MGKIIEFGVFIDQERLTRSPGRPSTYKKHVEQFMESEEPQARISCKNIIDARNKKNGFMYYFRTHGIKATAHLYGSSVVLVKEGV